MPMEKRNSSKGLKICCGVTTILLVVFIVACITLFFTVIKPKNPKIIPHPTKLENVAIQMSPNFSINATLALVVTVKNPNYGSFRFKNTTSYINYRGSVIAEVPLPPETVPSRGNLNMTAHANITGDKLVSSPFFMSDLRSGHFELTSATTMHGKVSVWKIVKFGAEVLCTCNISVSVLTRELDSNCTSFIKL